MKKVAFLITLLSASFLASAQTGSQIATGVKAEANQAWTWIQIILIFCIIVTTVVGIIVVYSKKNSDQPGEFKKYLMGFIYGVVFLFMSLGLLKILQAALTSTVSGMSF